MKNLLPPHIFLMCLLLAAALGIIDTTRIDAWPWNLSGSLLIVGGLALSIVGSRRFAAVGTNINPLNNPDILVTDGPFAHTRNPMYLGFVLALIGVAVVLSNLASLAAAVVFFLVIQHRFIPMEEAACKEIFGEAYTSYRRQVRRWI